MYFCLSIDKIQKGNLKSAITLFVCDAVSRIDIRRRMFTQ